MCNTRSPPCVPAPVSSPLGLCPGTALPSLQTLSFLEYDHKSSHCPLPASHIYPILDRFFSIQNRWPLTKVLLLNPPPPPSMRNYTVSTIHPQLTLPSSLIGDVLCSKGFPIQYTWAKGRLLVESNMLVQAGLCSLILLQLDPRLTLPSCDGLLLSHITHDRTCSGMFWSRDHLTSCSQAGLISTCLGFFLGSVPWLEW